MRAKRRKIGLIQWRQENKRLFAKHNRAGQLMRRRGMKRRTERKWLNAYMRYLDRIPLPEVVCYAEELW